MNKFVRFRKFLMKYDLLIGILIVFFIYLIPRIILGEDSFVTIHDNLDSEITWRTVLIDSDQVFKTGTFIEQIMNGIPRDFMVSGYNFVLWLYILFNPFVAYVINEILIHIIAFIGMYFLLRIHIFRNKKYNIIIFGISLCFSLLPFYSIYGLSIAGQPLLFYAFCNILRYKNKIVSYLIIIIFPFYSYLVLVGVFIIISLIAVFLYDVLKNKKVNKYFILGLLLLIFFYLLVEYNIVKSMIIEDNLISHRIDRNIAYFSGISTKAFGFGTVLYRTFLNLIDSHHHRASLHRPIFILWFITLIILLINTARGKIQKDKIVILIFIVFLILFLSFCSVFFYWKGFNVLKENISFLKTFDLRRIDWLLPFLWYILFAFLLSYYVKFKSGKIIVTVFIIGQLFYIFGTNERMFNELVINHKIIFNKLTNKKNEIITYKEFFSEKLFYEINDFIGRPQNEYRVVSLGIHPSIAQYNGFYTLDSYQNNYLLDYKDKFRKVIEKELGKSQAGKRWFDEWGNRCYFFSSELKPRLSEISPWSVFFENIKEKENKIHNLEINSQALKELGGKYIFSTYEILNTRENDLELLNIFEREDSPWRIYLYKVV